MQNTVNVTEKAAQLMRVLRANDASGNPQGLSTPQVRWGRVESGHPDDLAVQVIGMTLRDLSRVGLVARSRTGNNGARRHRLTDAGRAALQVYEQQRPAGGPAL